MNINEKINENYAKKTPLTDKSMIKGKDLDLLKQITGYLDEHGLTYEIKGSTQKNAEQGRARNYNDIDILVKKSDFKGRYDAVMELTRAAAKVDGFEFPKFMSHIVETNDNRMYVETRVEKSYTFARQDPKTKIDLNFEDNRNYK